MAEPKRKQKPEADDYASPEEVSDDIQVLHDVPAEPWTPVVDPEPEFALEAPEVAAVVVSPPVRLHVVKSEEISAHGAHYNLRAGQVITVPAAIAEVIIANRLATRM